jgi:hypothetical protein
MTETNNTQLDEFVESCFDWAEKVSEWAEEIKKGVKPLDSSNPPPPPPPVPNN